MMEINHLPPEMLLEVQRRLPQSSLKKVVLVDKLWWTVGENPTLWEKFTVTVDSKEDIKNLSIKRLQRIEEISINPDNWDVEDWEAFFRAVMGLSRLKKIDWLRGAWDGMKFVEPSLFARSLTKLEDVFVWGWTDDHIQALFSEMSISTKIKKLCLRSSHLSKLEPGLFGKVLSMLEELEVDNCDTTNDQIEALFTEITNNTSLKRLSLFVDRRCNLEPGLLARALSKVEDVCLTCHGMKGHGRTDFAALFTELSFGTHQLKRLALCGGDFSQMEPALFAYVLSRLEELALFHDRSGTGDQVQALFTEMSHRTQMKKLVLHDVGLSQLEVGLFARVMAKLEDVDLCRNHITAEQMVAFFTEISRNSHLKTLKISDVDKISENVDLSSVDPEVFGKALTRLEALTLDDTRITSDQAISLFSEMSQNMLMIKKIELLRINLSSVNLLTHDQTLAFFSEISRNTQMKKLKFGDDNYPFDLSTVDPDVLAVALTKVKEVDLSGSNLSTEQITGIFTHVLESEKKLKKLHLSYIGDGAQIDLEIVKKVIEKLKGELKLTATGELNLTD